ncbi:hypothetical protein HS088_TW06G01307 [Tripterygium wilfordii]|uniref:Uncharacterized protein n=1 Tax=Tripterygium wilfordii TaxID=458696 RepID=A0A7J7DM16_TRIWF|nr:uncharacterized protein LOC120000987 [Tripterygium wilfordii]KAF5747126.1 hypothetical protein HS088_TW06G01307 [Tripterygium wilfordii]
MNQRSFVVIFLFWAVLTIVTPTLIFLSESSESESGCNGMPSEEELNGLRWVRWESQQGKPRYVKARKALAPASAPAPYSGTGKQPEHDQRASWIELRGPWPPATGTPCHCQKSERNLWFGKKLLEFI